MFMRHILNQIIIGQLPFNEDFNNLLFFLRLKYENLHAAVLQEFGPNGFIVLALFTLFLFLIIIIYAVSVADMFRTGKKQEKTEVFRDAQSDYVTADEIVVSANDNNPETPLYDAQEKEQLEKERVLSADIVRASQETDDYLNLQQDYGKLKKKMHKHAHDKDIRIAKAVHDFGNKETSADLPTGRIEDFVSLILNLLSRGVQETKIVQALYNYYKSRFKEEDILQIVRSVRDFLGLCNAGKFDTLPAHNELPSLSDAVISLAQGQAKQCLILLQALLNHQMSIADSENGVLQDLNYAIAANYACIIGNLARLSDTELAHNSFELATELSPKNVRAWNRLGDMYMLENSPQKAMIAFQNVLDIGDRILYAPQIADAQQYLAAYFKNMGLDAKADELQTESDNFYKTYGIRTPLSPIEDIVFRTILNNSAATTPTSVASLLHTNTH